MNIAGIVVRGDGMGRQLGFPTANLDVNSSCGIPPGVYAVSVSLDGNMYVGALAVQQTPWKVEVHLLDVEDADLYDRHMHVEIKSKISEMEYFLSEEALIEKITRDINLVRSFFSTLR